MNNMNNMPNNMQPANYNMPNNRVNKPLPNKPYIATITQANVIKASKRHKRRKRKHTHKKKRKDSGISICKCYTNILFLMLILWETNHTNSVVRFTNMSIIWYSFCHEKYAIFSIDFFVYIPF